MEENHYYPFGLTLTERTFIIGEINDIKFGSKELDSDIGLNWYDFGARRYDMQLGRWTGMDPLADKYYGTSPFAYVANNPVKYIDPDGKRIVFVNGYLGFGSPSGGARYWGGSDSSFVNGAKSYFSDFQIPYFTNIGYGKFSSAEDRHSSGYRYAQEHYSELTEGMDMTKDNFEFVSHSMGTAEAAGIIDYMKQVGWNVTKFYSFNAFQAKDIMINNKTMEDFDTKTYTYGSPRETEIVDYQNINDPVINDIPFLRSPGDIPNADHYPREKSNNDKSYIHRAPINNGSIWKRIDDLINMENSGEC